MRRLTADEYIERYFTYHKPTEDQAQQMRRINDSLLAAARVIMDNCPETAERTLALRALEEARMRANQAIVVNEGEQVKDR